MWIISKHYCIIYFMVPWFLMHWPYRQSQQQKRNMKWGVRSWDIPMGLCLVCCHLKEVKERGCLADSRLRLHSKERRGYTISSDSLTVNNIQCLRGTKSINNYYMGFLYFHLKIPYWLIICGHIDVLWLV